MNVRLVTPVLNVADVPASLAWFEALGCSRTFTWNDASGIIENTTDRDDDGPANFAGLCSGRAEIFLCLDGEGTRGEGAGAWMSWWLESKADVHAAHELAVANNVEILKPPTEEPWGVLEYQLRHPDRHTFHVSAGSNSKET
jgi:uncharacterized glyoxalase superfamily protein PhnB